MGTSDRIIRPKEVCHRLSISRSTLYAWIKSGRFPRQRKLGPRCVGWYETIVIAWLAAPPPEV